MISVLTPKNHIPISFNDSFPAYIHTPSDNSFICILTKEVLESAEDADVGRKKTTSKAQRQKRKKQVGVTGETGLSTGLSVNHPPAPTGATHTPPGGRQGCHGWSGCSTLCGTDATHGETLVSMGTFSCKVSPFPR